MKSQILIDSKLNKKLSFGASPKLPKISININITITAEAYNSSTSAGRDTFPLYMMISPGDKLSSEALEQSIGSNARTSIANVCSTDYI